MSSYKYQDLLKEGYIKIKLTPEEHKEIFRNYNRQSRCEVYENENSFVRDSYEPLWIIVMNILLYPILLLLHGLSNVKEINNDIRSLFNQKENGQFIRDYIFKSDLIKYGKKFTDSFNTTK